MGWGFESPAATRDHRSQKWSSRQAIPKEARRIVHHGSDQWLYIVDGQGAAIVNGHRYSLKPGVLMLIEHGDTHEIRATGNSPLRTLNFYVPPGFDADGAPLPAGKP